MRIPWFWDRSPIRQRFRSSERQRCGFLFPARRRAHFSLRLVLEPTLDWEASVWCAFRDRSRRMQSHPPRASLWEIEPPVGTPQVKGKHRRVARRRRPRPRICLRKGCRRKYQPRRWNQRYCQDPHCQREVRRWQAAQRQARHRQDADVKARHAQAEKTRRQRAKSTSQTIESPEVTPARGHTAEPFFPLRSVIGRAATNTP